MGILWGLGQYGARLPAAPRRTAGPECVGCVARQGRCSLDRAIRGQLDNDLAARPIPPPRSRCSTPPRRPAVRAAAPANGGHRGDGLERLSAPPRRLAVRAGGPANGGHRAGVRTGGQRHMRRARHRSCHVDGVYRRQRHTTRRRAQSRDVDRRFGPTPRCRGWLAPATRAGIRPGDSGRPLEAGVRSRRNPRRNSDPAIRAHPLDAGVRPRRGASSCAPAAPSNSTRAATTRIQRASHRPAVPAGRAGECRTPNIPTTTRRHDRAKRARGR